MANNVITLNNAIDIIHQTEQPNNKLDLPFNKLLGYVLAEDINSTLYLPPFNKSAMDGYACKKSDLPKPLKITQTIAAGDNFGLPVTSGNCARIFTGAPVPEGADIVIMQEHTEVTADGFMHFKAEKSNTNICYRGEDLKPNDTVLTKGTLIRSEHIAIVASVGVATAKVWEKPTVAIMATGDELVEPGNRVGEGQIYNANGHQLTARLEQLNFEVNYLGIAIDTKEALLNKLHLACTNYDVVILTGGVSVGDYDLVPQVLADLGFKTHITTLNTKPGKHTLYATKGRCSVLGLPGNPVSTFVQMELCGLPLLYKKMGHIFQPLRVKVLAADLFKRKKTDRFEMKPVIITAEGTVVSMHYHGSAHIHAIGMANALLEMPVGIKSYNKGDQVYVRPL